MSHRQGLWKAHGRVGERSWCHRSRVQVMQLDDGDNVLFPFAEHALHVAETEGLGDYTLIDCVNLVKAHNYNLREVLGVIGRSPMAVR